MSSSGDLSSLRILGSSPSFPYLLHNPGHYYQRRNIIKVLIPISVLGWIAFGAICILCINGHGRAGRWIPEWYLDSAGTPWDKAAVVAWWLAVVFGWPLILPGVVIGHLSRKLRERRAEKKLAQGNGGCEAVKTTHG
jgi:hypothetical protein